MPSSSRYFDRVNHQETRKMAQTNPPFMTGVPELLLLRLLDQREMYGYELVKAIRLVTGEAEIEEIVTIGQTADIVEVAAGPAATGARCTSP